MSLRVLIIDNSAEFRELLGHHITSEWPDAEIIEHDPSGNGRLPERFAVNAFDIVLLDHHPAGDNGLEWLREFKRRPGFPPIIFLTAAGDELLAVKAIKAGADDYLPKHKVPHDYLIQAIRESIRKQKQTLALLQKTRIPDKAHRFGEVTIKGYRFVRRLATGSISSVYLARSEKLGHVVLKVLRQVPDVAEGQGPFERFMQEYEVIASIDHPNVVRIFELGIADDNVYIAMEYFPAGDLRSMTRKGIKPARALEYVKQMTSALQAIHAVGVLHRDLKPANVMIREDDSLALIDFGLAKQLRLNAELTDTGEIFGTPYYMSPEQGHAETVDERSDIYSLGVIFHEMITGKKPYLAPSPMAVIYKHSHAPLPHFEGPLSVMQPLIDKLMAKDPKDRFQSADEILEFLGK